MQKNIQEYTIVSENEWDTLDFSLEAGDRVFFYGDLGSGKTTCIRHILRNLAKNQDLVVRSPTYTYYQQYLIGPYRILHCDLYRLEAASTWIDIGGQELAENLENIFLIEWPEILSESISPTKIISISLLDSGERRIRIETVLSV